MLQDSYSEQEGGGRVLRWSWVNFQCRASYNLDDSRARAYCACSRCGWGLFGHFYSPLSFQGWSGGAKVLDKLPVPVSYYILTRLKSDPRVII